MSKNLVIQSQSMLTQNIPNQMTVHISHRVSQVSHCKHILVIDNGAVIQRGNHKELINTKGFYQTIFNKQQFRNCP